MDNRRLQSEKSIIFGENYLVDRKFVGYIFFSRELHDIKAKFSIFLKKFSSSEATKISADLKTKIDKYSNNEKSGFALGDYIELLNKIHIYLKERNESEIWKRYPGKIDEYLNHMLSNLNKALIEGEAIRLFNIASHGDAVIEFRRKIELRQKSINLILKLDKIISNVFESLPDLITVTGKISEIKNGIGIL